MSGPLEEAFLGLGGVFVSPVADMAASAGRVRAVVCDWDGVFNPGTKGEGIVSGFSEPDSMGLNLLRFGLWRRDGQMPVVAIVSGEHNQTALRFAEREHLHAVYLGILDKREAIRHLCQTHGLEGNEVAVVFDDVNDLGMAEMAGLRFLVRRPASPLLRAYAIEHRLCDYVTGTEASTHAVREVSELFLGLLGTYDEVVGLRAAFDADYKGYLAARGPGAPSPYVERDGRPVPAPPL